MKRKIIIDCDPGHDDALAIIIAAAHHEALDIAAITTVCGNNTLENVTHNAQVIATLLGKNYTVAAGMEHPLVTAPIISEEFHGVGGMEGPTDLPQPNVPVAKEHAVEVMRRILEENDKVTLVPLGPLTNIAVLLRMYPQLKEKIECISLMGGGVKGGNSSPHAEFNIHVDPEAAQVVFTSGLPIAMSGLDVTEQVLVYDDEVEKLRGMGALGKFVCEIMGFYGGASRGAGRKASQMHDPSAVSWLLKPELFEGTQGNVEVILSGEHRGRTVLNPCPNGNTLVLTGGKLGEISAFMVDSLEKACKEAT